MFAGDTSAFILELPTYHIPHFPTVFKYAFDRGLSFIKRAGTIILRSMSHSGSCQTIASLCTKLNPANQY